MDVGSQSIVAHGKLVAEYLSMYEKLLTALSKGWGNVLVVAPHQSSTRLVTVSDTHKR